MIYNGMCNNTKIDKTGRKIGKKSKELYILNVNDILNDFLTFFLLLNMSFYIFPNPPLPVYQIFTRRGNNQDKYNPGITIENKNKSIKCKYKTGNKFFVSFSIYRGNKLEILRENFKLSEAEIQTEN